MKKILLSLFLASSIAQAQAPVSGIMQPLTTRAWDNARTGWNPHETILNVANVKTQGLRKYFTLPMEGDARGTEAQPLILPSVLMPDGHKRRCWYSDFDELPGVRIRRELVRHFVDAKTRNSGERKCFDRHAPD